MLTTTAVQGPAHCRDGSGVQLHTNAGFSHDPGGLGSPRAADIAAVELASVEESWSFACIDVDTAHWDLSAGADVEATFAEPWTQRASAPSPQSGALPSAPLCRTSSTGPDTPGPLSHSPAAAAVAAVLDTPVRPHAGARAHASPSAASTQSPLPGGALSVSTTDELSRRASGTTPSRIPVCSPQHTAASSDWDVVGSDSDATTLATYPSGSRRASHTGLTPAADPLASSIQFYQPTHTPDGLAVRGPASHDSATPPPPPLALPVAGEERAPPPRVRTARGRDGVPCFETGEPIYTYGDGGGPPGQGSVLYRHVLQADSRRFARSMHSAASNREDSNSPWGTVQSRNKSQDVSHLQRSSSYYVPGGLEQASDAGPVATGAPLEDAEQATQREAQCLHP